MPLIASFIGIALLGAAQAAASGPQAWRDSSPHTTRMVTVETDVRLEVLDWGGRGRPVVLLTGMGLTAHVFDEFAPKLAGRCHVYAVTRRGYGASSHPTTGYDDQRLADDVLAVLNQLKLATPVLVGHSLAGGELATLGRQHSARLGGLVFVEALDDPEDELGADAEWTRLLSQLPPGFLQAAGQAPSGPSPDYSSFGAFRAWQARTRHYALPESELRQQFIANADGTMGGRKRSTDTVDHAIGEGQKKREYAGIRVPVLAIRGLVPQSVDDQLRASGYRLKRAEDREAIEAFTQVTKSHLDRWVMNLKSAVPDAGIIDYPGAGHYVFLTKEADVLRDVQTFVARVP